MHILLVNPTASSRALCFSLDGCTNRYLGHFTESCGGKSNCVTLNYCSDLHFMH